MKKGWQTKKLGDVCAFDKAQGIHRGLPYVGLEHIESHTARFIGSTEAQPVKSSTFRFSDEHVLYGRLRPYLNKALAPDFEGHCSTEIFPLKPRPELSREYLLFWLLADETCDRINETCTGARMPRAQMNNVLGFEIPVPPLAEQQRIVSLLDEAFECLATAKANAEKNLQNARALFESHLQSVFTQRGPGWVEKRLWQLGKTKDSIVSGPFGSNLKVSDYKIEGIPILRLQNVGKGYFVDKNIKYISGEKANELKYHSFMAGDIVLAKLGIPVGKTCIVPNNFAQGIITADVVRVRPDPTVVDYKFLTYFLNTDISVLQLTGNISGATRPRVNLSDVRDIQLNLPPLKDQQKIVRELDKLTAETQRLARIYEQKLAALEALKKSLLHQAFSGEL